MLAELHPDLPKEHTALLRSLSLLGRASERGEGRRKKTKKRGKGETEKMRRKGRIEREWKSWKRGNDKPTVYTPLIT